MLGRRSSPLPARRRPGSIKTVGTHPARSSGELRDDAALVVAKRSLARG